MPRQLTDDERHNVQRRVTQLIEAMTEAVLEAETGVPQSTLNHIKLRAKVGIQSVRRIAAYLERTTGETVDNLLSGTGPAGFYLPQDMSHPTRGKVLDALRHIVPKEILDEVFAIELPRGATEWTESEWLDEVNERFKRWKRLGKPSNLSR